MNRHTILPSIFVAMVSIGAGLAQTASTSVVNGTVLDAQGAAVPGAKITVLNTETGAVRTATSTDTGQYVVSNLEPGDYQISVEIAGFNKAIAKGVPLEVAKATTKNFKLEIGTIATSVEVAASEPPLQTLTAWPCRTCRMDRHFAPPFQHPWNLCRSFG